jgi:hypothetical protein
MNFQEKMTGDITGHLTIHKKYKDGTEELHFDDHNVIVSGMSVGLSMFFTGSGSNSIVDYQIDRYQVGVSGPPAGGDVSSIYQLSGPINTEAAYNGLDANIFVETADAIENGSDASNRVFVRIPFSKVTRIDDVSVRYTLVLDEQAALNLTSADTRDGPSGDNVNVSEIGLFMKNPDGRSGTPASILVAYRSFTPIRKSDDFAIVFRWSICF